jgi:predicted transposase YbfD/YdcC
MSKRKRRDLTADEQRILENGHIQLLTRHQDFARCDELIVQHHYLQSASLDGKKVRHGGVEIVNAVDGAGRFLGSVVTPAKTNEIPAARQLLRPQNLIGKTVIGDALHTQYETAQQILYEQGGDYLLTVKANQKTLQETLQSLFAQQAFSPSAHPRDLRGEAGAQPRTLGNSGAAMSRSDPGPSGLPGSSLGGPIGDARPPQG